MLDWANVKAVVMALIIIGAVALTARCAHAQLAVSDAPVETFTGDLDQNLVPNLLTQDTATATSLTTTGGTDSYTPNQTDIAKLDHILFSGVTYQDFGSDTLFPGWQACSPDCTTPFNLIVNASLATYQAAMETAQTQETELAGEDFTDISTNSQTSTYVLPVLQDLVQSQLQTARELQYIRNQLDTLIMVEATNATIPISTKAQDRANSISIGNPLLHGLLP